MSLIVDGESKASTFAGLVFCLLIFLVGLICAFAMKEEKNREKAEKDSIEKRRTSASSDSNS
jgi:Na+/melibiose symporter-like transporter